MNSGIPLLIFAVLLFAVIGWCLISSCIGKPVLRFFSGLWEASVQSARFSNTPSARRRKELGENELWEMEFRGRAG